MSTQYGDLQWFSSVQAAFPDQELCKRIFAEASYEPTRLPRLFEDISRYVLSLNTQQQHAATQEVPSNSKKRKLDDGLATPLPTQANGATPTGVAQAPVHSFECKDVSVQIPARKKLKVQLVRDDKEVRRSEIRLLNSTTSDLEYGLPADAVDQVFCLPVPDKQARQSYFAIVPRPGTVGADGMPKESILFTLNETSPPVAVSSTEDPVSEDDTHVSVMQAALEKLLAPYGKRLVTPDAAEFASARPQLSRKGEKAYHVNAHRGSKEGYLFFLPNGILFGFKKPLAFFPFSVIESISYTSVLQRTFDLVISATNPTSGVNDVKETEFSMLDQEDFAGIDDYVKRHGLNDASMAADRRAKAYNVNKVKGAELNGEAAAGGSDEDGQTELQKAEQQLQDEEDEEEEDYEASGGESDGEGEESEDEDEDEYGDGNDEDAEGAEDDEEDG